MSELEPPASDLTSKEREVFSPDPSDPIDVAVAQLIRDIMTDRLPTVTEQRRIVAGVQHHDRKATQQLIGRHKEHVAGVAYQFKGRGIRSKDLFILGARVLNQLALNFDLKGPVQFDDYLVEGLEGAYKKLLGVEESSVDEQHEELPPMQRVIHFVTGLKPDPEAIKRLPPRLSSRIIGRAALSTETGLSRPSPERVRRHFRERLKEYITAEAAGLSDSELEEYQQDVFHDIYKFISTPERTDEGSPQYRGYIESPPGTGKTAVIAKLVDVLNQPIADTSMAPTALILVPKLDLIGQTIGVNGKRGFAQFGQNTTATEYSSRYKDLGGEAVVMTYRSLISAVKKGIVSKGMFDLVICDEAHKGMGSLTRRAIELVADEVPIIGVTASPQYKNRHVKDFLPTKIHRLGLRETINRGILSSVQGYAIASEVQLERLTYVTDDEFTQKELDNLIKDEWRNQKTIEFAKVFIEHGKQGLIPCVNIQHAREIQTRLANTFIVDPKTGELRRIRAITITGETTDRYLHYEDFERGTIDVFTYVDVLTEGWDSKAAKFSINLRPTTSPAVAIQRIGRLLRKSDDPEDVAIVIEFIDKTNKSLYTFFHAMGEKIIRQGKVYGKRVPKDSKQPSLDTGGRAVKEFPTELLGLIQAIDHITMDSLLVRQGYVPRASEGVRSVNVFARQEGMSPTKVQRVIEKLELDLGQYRFDNNAVAPGLTPEMQAALLEDPELRIKPAPEGVISVNAFIQQHHTHRSTAQKLISRLELDLNEYKFSSRDFGLTPEMQAALLEEPELKTELPPEGVPSINVFARREGTSVPTVKRLLKQLGLNPKEYRYGNQITPGLNAETQALLLTQKELTAEPAPNGVLSPFAFSRQEGLSFSVIQEFIKTADLDLTEYRFGTQIAPGLDAETQRLLLEKYQARNT